MTRPLSTGIIGVVGKPGSGKSFLTVLEICRVVCEECRPVYTNIPIKQRRLRAYIYRKLPPKFEGHATRRAMAQLVKPITRTHFDRFTKRLAFVKELTEKLIQKHAGGDLNDLAEFDQDRYVAQAMRIVARVAGPPRIVGRDADWIVPGSVLFMDELHLWYPSRSYRDEAPEVLLLTSMHRHLQLRIYVMTQRWLNASLSFRSMADQIWTCMNGVRLPAVETLGLHHWMNFLKYTRWMAEDFDEREDKPRPGARPLETICRIPELSGGVEYSLYSSHSHMGSADGQRLAMSDTVKQITGVDLGAIDDMAKERKARLSRRLFGWVVKAAFLVLAFSLGRCTTPPQHTIIERLPDTAVVALAGDPGQPAPTVPPLDSFGKLGGVLPGGAVVGGHTIKLGQRHERLVLYAVSIEEASTIWIDPGQGFVAWSVGRVPVRLDRLPPVLAAQLRGVLERARRDSPAPDGAVPGDLDAPGLE